SDHEISEHLQKADAALSDRAELLRVLEDEHKKLDQETDKIYDH
ncbi:MAG: hypothetical protein JWN13_3743, partial [Betaproteobacteria bacterium]|nr:hypothetical protein [Betaproteobacteria bacterium]